ncbi:MULTISPECIES: hypothetical protein [unclassified Streptomyces]|uniref:hypothetical protein n=1 Tax=unclassified Streptomyces TaxID=2593676 RepID=UPI0036EA61AE
MALNLGELVAGLRADESGFVNGLTAAQLAMRGLTRDVDGRLRDMNGRFVNESEAMGQSLAYRIGRGARGAVKALHTVAVAVTKIGVGIPAIAAVTTALGGLAAGAVAAGVAAGAFKAAAQPQLELMKESAAAADKLAKAEEDEARKKALAAKLKAQGSDLAEKAEKAYTTARLATKDAELAYQRQTKDLPKATAQAALEQAKLKAAHEAWSASLASSTMPVFTKGMQILRGLFPVLTPFVKAAAGAFGGFLDDVARGVKSAGFKEWADDMSAAAGPALSNFLTVIKNLGVGFAGLLQAFLPVSDEMTGGLAGLTEAFANWGTGLGDSAGFAQFMALASEGGQTLGTLAGAGLEVLTALSPLIGVTSQLALFLAQIINSMPPGLLTAIATGWVAIGLAIKAYGLYTTIAAAATRAWAIAQGIWNTVMMANPIGLVIALLVGLGIALVIAYQKSETFRDIVQGVWTAVKEAISASIEWIKGALAWFGTLPGLVGGWFGSAKDAAVAKFTELTTWLGGLPGRAGAALGGLAGTLSASASKGFQSFRDAAVQKATAFGVWVSGWPGRISAAIGSLSGLLYSKGVAVVQGLWNGIKAMGGWLKDTLIGWASDVIPGPIAKALGIASPSKVTKAQGRWIARGLIEGLTGSQKQVRAASYKLVDIIRDGLTRSREAKALRAINKRAGKLDWLAGWDAKIGAQLKTARKKLADLRKSRDKLAADVRKGILDSANITQQDTGGWAPTAETILAGLKADTAAAETFAKNLAILRKKGVRSDLIAQIAQAGVEQGGATAQALANANGGQIKQINAQQQALVNAAGAAGTMAGNAMYGAGIKAGEGLVRGLASHQKQIEAQMLKIAKSMQAAIKKALGIKSPSRVMADIGRYIPRGLVKGIEAEQPAVDRTMRNLVSTPSPSAMARSGSWDMASSRARARAADRAVLELRSSGRKEDDYIIERLRRGIQKKGGGDVDLVLAGRRSG